MKTKSLVGLMLILLCACDEERPPALLSVAQMKILKEATEERDEAVKRLAQIEKQNIVLETQIGILTNQLALAKDSCDLYEKLLDDSNEAKLRRARELLREAMGK